MSLRFVIGRTGTGKTNTLFEEMIKKSLREPLGSPIIYIVPEQMSFTAENRFVHMSEASGMIRAQVYSFTRLAWRIFQETGGASRMHLSSTGVNMLIRKIIEENKRELKVFKRAADKIGFVQHIEQLLTEFKNYCITVDDLAEKKDDLQFGMATRGLGDKLHDLELIYEKFEQYIAGKYLGAHDYLQLLAESIEDSKELQDAEIYIDGFYSFTTQELIVIQKLLETCKRVTIALTIDRPYKTGKKPDELDVFKMTGETYFNIYELAKSHGIAIEEDVFLYESKRTSEPSLQHLEQNVHIQPTRVFEGEAALQISTAANRRAEIEGIAREIRKLSMEKDFRYKDMAIYVRNSESYREIIETVFTDYDIPFFIDQKHPMFVHPLIEFIRSSLEVIKSNWRYEPVFRAIKTELLFPKGKERYTTRYQMDRFENYVIAHGKKGSDWQEQWEYKEYKGLEFSTNTRSEREKQMEESINQLKTMVAEPLLAFEQEMKKAKNVREYCMAIFSLLETMKVPDKLESRRMLALENDDLIAAKRHQQAWDSIIHLLEQYVEILGEESVPLHEFIRILDSGLEALKFTLIPPAIDQVFVADVELSRLDQMKAIFVIGFNDGIYPNKQAEEGIFSENERELLIESGIELAPTLKSRLLDEQFLIYRTFTSPSERLYISYPLADAEGKGLLPSMYVKQLVEMFPQAVMKNIVVDPSELSDADELEYVSHPYPTMAYLSSQLQLKKRHYEMSDFWWDIYNYYISNCQWNPKVKRVLASLFYENKTAPLTHGTASHLYGNKIYASVSKIEKYYSCPFAYFASSGLRLKERQVYRLEAPHIGDLFHGALKLIDQNVPNWRKLKENEYERYAKDAVAALAPKLQHNILSSSYRNQYIRKKLEKIIERAVQVLSEHAKKSSFEIAGFELDFGPDRFFETDEIQLNEHVSMQLQGRIDRVDGTIIDKEIFVRIIDFKSSAHDLDLEEVLFGISLQMLTYLDIVLDDWQKIAPTIIEKQNSSGDIQSSHPAGVLYFHLKNPIIESEANEMDIDAILREFKMSGKILDDMKVIEKMDTSLSVDERTSKIIPVEIKKDETISARSKKNVLPESSFNHLRDYVNELYEHAGNQIMSGDVKIHPYKLKDKIPCTFCEYRSVCQFDLSLEKNKYHQTAPLNKGIDDIVGMKKNEGEE